MSKDQWRGVGENPRRAIERHLVDALDAMVDLDSERSRLLLARLVGRELGGRIRVTDLSNPRQWLVRLVEICAERRGGMAALAAAITDLEPEGTATAEITRLTTRWEQAGTSASDRPSAPGPGQLPASAQPNTAGVGGVGDCGGGQATDPKEGDTQPEKINTARNVHGFSDGEMRALAAAFPESIDAKNLLAAAGLAPERQPGWSARNALEFWTEVNHLLTVGGLADGRRRILAAAADCRPGNPHFGGFSSHRLC